jgi:hypothetical protein
LPESTVGVGDWRLYSLKRVQSLACSESALVEFLAGSMSASEERAFDEHLLTCEECWRAVREDRVGARAVRRLREVAPPDLSNRISLAIELTATNDLAIDDSAPQHRRYQPRRAVHNLALRAGRRPRAALAVASVVVIASVVTGWTLARTVPPQDPPVISAVMAMASSGPEGAATSPHAVRLDIAGQHISARAEMVTGTWVVVATSMRPFPMATSAHLIAGSTDDAWMASSKGLGMYCVSAPAGTMSVLVTAAVPVERLPAIAAHLHLL